MKCPKCGRVLGSPASFCSHCKSQLSRASAPVNLSVSSASTARQKRKADETLTKSARLVSVLVDPTAWITDDVIDFAVTNDLAVTTHNVQFVQASVVVAMANAQSAGPAITAPIVLLPVSRDNLHWSLLVYDVEQSKCFHYDSLKSQNKAYVANLVGVLKQSNWLPSDATFVEVEGLTQKDEYNCGMFVIELMERIAQAGNANLPPEYLRDALSSDICNKRRQALLARLCERDVFKPQPVSPRDPCRPEAGLQRDLRGPLWSKIFTALRAEKAQWKEVYLEFERSGRFKQLVFDDFIPEYETFYQDYLKRKAIMANALKLRPLGSESRRKTWPALRHSLHESLDRKKYILRPKAYYKESQFRLDEIKLPLRDGSEMLDTAIMLALWRKVFSAHYPKGYRAETKKEGVAHMLRLSCDYGVLFARNVKNTEGNGTTRMLMQLSTKGPVYLDASYSMLHNLLKSIVQQAKSSDADVAQALLFLVHGNDAPKLNLKQNIDIGVNKVVQEKWKAPSGDPNLFFGSDNTGGVLKDLSGMEEVTGFATYNISVGLALTYVVSVLFLAETRHAHVLWLGNRYILELVAQGRMSFEDIFTCIDEKGKVQTGSLIPSNQFKPGFNQYPASYNAAKNRLLIAGTIGYYVGEEHASSDEFLDVRAKLALSPTDLTDTKLFVVHKLLFAWLLVRALDLCDPTVLNAPSHKKNRAVAGAPVTQTIATPMQQQPAPVAGPGRGQSLAPSPYYSSLGGQQLSSVGRGNFLEPAKPLQVGSRAPAPKSAPPLRGANAPANPASINQIPPSCPKCGAPMVLRKGYNSFWGCSKYLTTGCKGTRQLNS